MFSCRRFQGLFFIVIFAVLLIPTQAFSEGKIIIKPTLKASWQTDSNFFKAQTNEREVHTYLIQPGVQLGYETPKSLVTLDYTLDSHNYDDQDALQAGWIPADEGDFTGHTLAFKARTRPTERLTLGLEESYQKSRDPGNSDTFSNSVAREKFTINRLTPSVLYGFGAKFSAGIRYRQTDTDYDPVLSEDSTEKRPMFNLVYNFSSKTSIDLEYQYWTRDYDLLTSTYDSNQVKLIFRKQFNYFFVEVGGGYHDRSFDDPTLNDIDVVTYNVAIKAQNPPAPDPPKSYIAFTAEQNFNDSGTGDSYFVSNRFILNAGYVFMGKIPVDLSASFQNSDYERTFGLTPAGTNELRDDDTYNYEGKIGYIITDWLRFSVKAGYEDRDSNHAGKDYDNKYMMATIDFAYNIGKR